MAKLLLTSGGLTNNSITRALFNLTGKAPEQTTVVVIPTASNLEEGDKGWFITDLINLYKQNFKSVEITDISAVDEKVWRPSLNRADVLFFAGGNTYHLMRWLNKTGLTDTLSTLLRDKVYVGVSAGSMVACPDLNLESSPEIREEDLLETEEMKGLGLVNFYFLPHLNSVGFKKMRKKNIKKAAKNITIPIYALDDESALKIIDDKIEVISEGNWYVVG